MNCDWLFHALVTQTLQVTLLAGFVLVLSRFFAKDRPHLAHALWALVLLKCLTPPIVASPTSVFSWLPNEFALVSHELNSVTASRELALVASDHMDGLAPVVIKVPRGDAAQAVTNSVSSVPTREVSAVVEGSKLIATAIYVWILVAALVFAVNALRLWVFLQRVKKVTLPTSRSLDRLVESVSKRIGLRRNVRIRTVDAAFGPAVVGFIRPTILLPKVIAEGKAEAELDPLLAHELIHIRRGDLVWAMLQGMSVSLWWFNPLIWLADRLLTREAERSCDEETIAGLGCSPAVYARSLLDVMERKHQLRAAPSLPGVRPVDITAKRLERIMRLGNGCYRQRPWWVVAVWLIGCAVFLPGGAWLTAQENTEQKPSAFKEASFSSEIRQQAAPAKQREIISNPVAKDPVATHQDASEQSDEVSFQFDHVQEVADVLERLCKERKLEKPEAEKELIRLLAPLVAPESGAAANTTAQSPDLSLEDATALTIKSTRQLSTATSIKVAGKQLHIRATNEKRKQIEQRLAHFRQFGFASIVTEIDLYEVPRSLTEKDLAAIRKNFASNDDETNAGIAGAIVLDEVEIAKFDKWLAEESNRNILHVSSPRVISLSGQLATVEIGDARDFTVAHNLVKTKDREPTAVPVIERVASGSRCEIRATLTGGLKDDSQKIMINANFQRTEIERIDRLKQRLDGIGEELDVERPIVRRSSVEASVELDDNDALFILETSADTTSITLVRCTPLAGPLVKVPQASLGEGAQINYVTVSDELKSDLEIALLKQKLEQLGNEDYRIEEGRIQVNFAEDWEAATRAFQELRSHRNSTATSTKVSPQKDSHDTTFTDGETDYQPIQVFGPFTRAQAVPVLDQVPYVNRLFKGPVKREAPSDDEIFQALEKDTSEKRLALNGEAKGQLKITATKIKDFADPASFFPLFGDAILHHSHYKCEFHDAATQELKHTAYIDYCQFQVVGGSEK